MTPNGSTLVASTVTRNTCQDCAEYREPPTNKAYALGGTLHCKNCHAEGHLACVMCGKCLPKDHRYDRRYCSSSCRVKGHMGREHERMERAIWEAEHPEEARQLAEERERAYQEWVEIGKALSGKTDKQIARKKQRKEIIKRADRCAEVIWHPESKTFSDCGKVFGPGEVIYRRREDITSPVRPYCLAHRCPQPTGRHNRDAREGYYYVNCRCEDKHWQKPEPCLGCGRLVSYPKGAGWRLKAYRYNSETSDWETPYVFCGEYCRHIVFAAKRKAKRLAQRATDKKVCPVCQTAFKGHRGDAVTCSPACRQKMYRRRAKGSRADAGHGRDAGGEGRIVADGRES